MEGFSGLLEFFKPVKLSDIVLDVSETAEDFVVFRVHCKYDTQATGDEIVEKLKTLDKLSDSITLLEKEISDSKLEMESMLEYHQGYIKAYLDGLRKALALLSEV